MLGDPKNWFKYRGEISNKSYNDLLDNGYYKIGDNVIDGPNNYWGTLIVFYTDAAITQLFFPNIDASNIMIRKTGRVSDISNASWRMVSLTEIL